MKLIPHRGKQFTELGTIGEIALLVRVLHELFQHEPITGCQPVLPGIFSEEIFFFFDDQNGARKSRPFGIVVGLAAKLFRFVESVQEA